MNGFFAKSLIVAFGWVVLSAGRLHAGSTQLLPSLSLSEINLNWFGLNGSPNNALGSETRTASIRQFFLANHLLTDVMVFEEIVDLKLLQSSVLNNEYACHTYDRADPKHQHVVICHTAKFRLDPADGSSGYELATVDVTGHLRPAVHGILKTLDGTRVAHIVGVHLKAKPDQSPLRTKQVQALETYLTHLSSVEPVVVMGDFNTYASDPENFNRTFSGASLQQLESPEPFTWASSTENFAPAKFDRVWITSSLQRQVTYDEVLGPCSSGNASAISTYNKAVSDHCPVRIVLGN